MADSQIDQVQQQRPQTIASILADRRITPWQIAVVVVGLAVLLVDGLDLQLLSYVAPVVTQDWGIQPAQLGVALSGALIGMAIGTAVGGLLGDRIGRRRAALISVLVFGAATAAAALSPGVPVLTVLRIIAGLGFGAAMPNIYVLASEVLPVRARPRAAGLLSVGTPVGGLLGGALALALLTAIGWRMIFVVCGVLSLLLVVLILAFVPESPSYQLTKGDQAGARRTLRRLLRDDANLPDTLAEDTPKQERARGQARELLTREHLRTNIATWMGFFASQFVSYAMIAWLPMVLTGLGMPLEAGIRAGIVYNACAVVGALLVGPTIAWIGSRWAILGVAVLAAIAVTAAPMVVGPERSAVLVLCAIGLGGFSIGLAIAALYAVTPQAYPAAIRATGLGFAVTWGRLAGITTTLVGGVVLTLAAGSPVPFFGMLLVACALVFVAALVLERHIPARSAGAQ